MRKILSMIKFSIVESFIYKLLVFRHRYPDLYIHPTAKLLVDGEIKYRQQTSIGGNTFIRISKAGSLILGGNCYLGSNLEIGTDGVISIGDHTTIQHRSTILGDVNIGRYCTFGPNVYISSGNHNFDVQPELYIRDQDKLVAEDPALFYRRSKKVIVGDDCWIGINVAVMPGVTIGKGAVVGASSVVTKDVAPYTVVAGVPAKLIRSRLVFSPPSQIKADSQKDWPYFYSGFCLSKDNLNDISKYGGVLTVNNFTVCLSSAAGSKIHIIVRSMTDSETTIYYNSTCYKVTKEFKNFDFDVHESALNMFHFSVNAEHDDVQLIVKKVWIQ
jgi:acetyltransferase-like isoleucine patch superfamily enzyme